jgi:hypothetical protein
MVIIARATAPDSLGAGTMFPGAGIWDPENGLSGSPIASPMFWVCLISQLVIVVGYFWFYRREELGKLMIHPLRLDVAHSLPQHDLNRVGKVKSYHMWSNIYIIRDKGLYFFTQACCLLLEIT